MLRDQRRDRRSRDRELETEPFRILEAQPAVLPGRLDSVRAEPLLPEVERLLGADAPRDRVDHPGAGPPAPRARVLEERDVGAGAALLVRVEQVVDGRVVLVDRLLDEPQPEDADVELDVAAARRP